MKGVCLLTVFASLLFLIALADPPHRGPFEVEFVEYEVETLSEPYNEVVVAYPKSLNGSFPLVNFYLFIFIL